MFWSKTFSVRGELLVAICDDDLLGKEIGKNFKVKVEEKFYGGEIIDEKKALELMRKSTSCNLLGKNIIELALKNKFITEKNVMFIGDIPHAQFIK